MSHATPLPSIAEPEGYTVVLAKGYLNFIGETRIYFRTESLGWGLFFDVSDQGLKQQIFAAFATPDIFKVYLFHRGMTVAAVQVSSVA